MADRTSRSRRAAPISNADLVRTFLAMSHRDMRPAFINTGGAANYRSSILWGQKVRDTYLHQYAILPGAVTTFVDVATSREWLVAGKPRPASRAVNKLNNAHFTDASGLVHRGWEQFMALLCMDWLTIGRCMYSSVNIIDDEWTAPEYIDPSRAEIYNDPHAFAVDTHVKWLYSYPNNGGTEVIPQDEMFFMDSNRIGSSGAVVGRVSYLLATANLDYLLRQHDEMQLDGRKVREVLMVPAGMADQVGAGINVAMALTAGVDIEESETGPKTSSGIPIIEIDTAGLQMPLRDMIAKLGLSEIPREFSREEFEGRYVREIAATLGLPIGQFWYDPRGTNRSLEQVQQERATLKGPSYFVRSLSRKINQSPILGRTPGTRAVLIFDEETDNTSLKMNAEALDKYADAITKINALSAGNPEMAARWMAFFEQKGLIPNNSSLPDVITREESSLLRSTVLPDEEKPSADQLLDKGWVLMDRYEHVVERRAEFMVGVLK